MLIFVVKATYLGIQFVEDGKPSISALLRQSFFEVVYCEGLCRGKDRYERVTKGAHASGAVARAPYIRNVTGWFRDMSYYLGGFKVLQLLKFPQLQFDFELRWRGWEREEITLWGGATLTRWFKRCGWQGVTIPYLWPFERVPGYRKKTVGDVDIGRDAGFVVLSYGFSIFFLCIALAPPTCLGCWIGVSVITGSLPLGQAWGLLIAYYQSTWASFLLSISCILEFQCTWDWPE